MNKAHKFTHAIAMIIWRKESMLSNQPSGWENDKIKQCHSRFISWCGQHCTYEQKCKKKKKKESINLCSCESKKLRKKGK